MEEEKGGVSTAREWRGEEGASCSHTCTPSLDSVRKWGEEKSRM